MQQKTVTLLQASLKQDNPVLPNRINGDRKHVPRYATSFFGFIFEFGMPPCITENNLNIPSLTFTAIADNVYHLSDEKVRELGGGKCYGSETCSCFL
jgi:hypothetical protein